MPDIVPEEGSSRPVWRRAATTPTAAATPTDGSDRPLRCGGPELDVHERFYLMREKRRSQLAEQARLREEAEERDAAKERVPDDEDEDRAAERFRNDRYAVKLLHQDDSAWVGGTDPGALG